MAKVLQNFLIGVGLDTEDYDKGAKNVESSLSRMRSLVGFTGTAFVGAFGFAGVAAIDAGKRIDKLMLATEGLKTSPEYVNAYGRALAAMGGDAEDALSTIKSLEDSLTEMRVGASRRLFGEDELVLAGMDVLALRESKSGSDYLRNIAKQMPGLSNEQQRSVQNTLGLTDGVMRSVREGVGSLDASIEQASALYGEFGRATEAAREYVGVVADLNTQFQGIGETLAENLLPSFTGILRLTSDFISENRSALDGAIGKIGQITSDNPVATTVAGSGAAAAATGAGLRMIGLRAAGIGAMRLGVPGMVLGGGLLAADAFARQGIDTTDIQSIYSGDTTEYQAAGMDEPQTSGADYVPPRTIIDNIEAAKSSPDAIIINGQRQQTDNSVRQRPIKVENNIKLGVELDGRAIESKVTDVIERRERDAMDDVYSSVDR